MIYTIISYKYLNTKLFNLNLFSLSEKIWETIKFQIINIYY